MTPYLQLVLLGALAVAQTTVMTSAKLGTVKPLLPLLAVVSWTLLRGPVSGAWWAVAAGILLDVVSPGGGAYYTVPLVAAAAAVAAGRARLFPGHPLIPWVLTAVATACFVLVQRTLLPLAGAEVVWSSRALAREMLPELALNLLWLPAVYVPLRALARRERGPRLAWER